MQGEPKSSGSAEVEIFFVDLVEAEAALEDEERRTPRLSDADIVRAGAMADGDARRIWLATRIATRIALERIGGAGFRRVAFHIEPGGRPTLGEAGPYFSVSHTDGVALIAVAKARAIGVDLEAKTRVLHMSVERRRRIIHAVELMGPQAPLTPEADGDVLVAWVQLEAAAKALGIGIGRLLTEAGVVGGSKAKPAPSERVLAVQSLRVGTDHVGGIAARYLPDDVAVKPFPHTQLDAFLRGQ